MDLNQNNQIPVTFVYAPQTVTSSSTFYSATAQDHSSTLSWLHEASSRNRTLCASSISRRRQRVHTSWTANPSNTDQSPIHILNSSNNNINNNSNTETNILSNITEKNASVSSSSAKSTNSTTTEHIIDFTESQLGLPPLKILSTRPLCKQLYYNGNGHSTNMPWGDGSVTIFNKQLTIYGDIFGPSSRLNRQQQQQQQSDSVSSSTSNAKAAANCTSTISPSVTTSSTSNNYPSSPQRDYDAKSDNTSLNQQASSEFKMNAIDLRDPAVSSTNSIQALENVEPPNVFPWDSTSAIRGLSYLDRIYLAARKRNQILARAYEECERITAVYAKTFYLGTSFLSYEKRRAVWAIYVWCRRTDDLVDGPRASQHQNELRSILANWERRLEDIFAGKPHDSLDLALYDVKRNYPALDIKPFKDMIQGMIMDIDQDRYETFEDLFLYCYRVAGTVGLMTLPVMGTVKNSPDALTEAAEPALALGVGLQLTNILRDVGEDRQRKRIYLPLEDLRRFGYTEMELMQGVMDDRYRKLIQYQIERARIYYTKAEEGIMMLSEDARLPVRASLDMYSHILNVLEANNYDNFTKRAYVSKKKKLAMLPWSYLKCQDKGFWFEIRKLLEGLGTKK